MADERTRVGVAALVRHDIEQMTERTVANIRAAIEQTIEDKFPEARGDVSLIEDLAKEFETIFDVKQTVGKIIHQGHKEWLRDAHRNGKTNPYYWPRYRMYLKAKNILPADVINTLDTDTELILDHAGNPHAKGGWAKRGMVLGHVQSGKTTNYSALICKAADAGYKVIVLLSGTSTHLRRQTQRRIDESFIGRNSIFEQRGRGPIGAGRYIPPGYEGSPRFPTYGTTVLNDFVSTVAQSHVSIQNTQEPIIFVVKKNYSILSSLREWVLSQHPQGGISHPLLLIDDEADNASINTRKDPGEVTRINEEIRTLLSLFNRHSYIGYTATPFANIFIEPDSEEQMWSDDLFPGNFIKALDAPGNYIGADDVFPEEESGATIVRAIDDYREIPLKHNSSLRISALPQSLMRAIRLFVLCRALLISRGKGGKHSTMMINVSRLTVVQSQIFELTKTYLEDINYAMHRCALDVKSDKESWAILADLERDFESEYGSKGKWKDIRGHLVKATGSIEVRTVNSKSKDGVLDYDQPTKRGLHVIAVGGLALSRGLTLEGLCISYMIRNAGAYDTLMQMARWFGYRGGYGDICRVFLPDITKERYGFVREATEELRGEIDKMEYLGQTPRDFGLKVRRHEASVFHITAINKMRKAKTMTIAEDFACKQVQGNVLFSSANTNKVNYEHMCQFVRSLGEPWGAEQWKDVNPAHSHHIFWRGVKVDDVLKFLASFQLPNKNFGLSVVDSTAATTPARRYIYERMHELGGWDVCIPCSQRSTARRVSVAGHDVLLRERKQGQLLPETKDGRVLVKGQYYKLMPKRVSSRLDAAIGMNSDVVNLIDPRKRSDGTLLAKRDRRPLLLLHALNASEKPEGDSPVAPFFGESTPAVTYCLCFPSSSRKAEERQYAVNSVYQQLLEGTDDDITQQDDDEEE